MTIRLDRDYNPQQYYEGGYGEEQDQSEEDPSYQSNHRNTRQVERNQRVEEMRMFRSPQQNTQYKQYQTNIIDKRTGRINENRKDSGLSNLVKSNQQYRT